MSRSIISDIKKDHIHKLIEKGRRVDGRNWNEFREVSVESDYIEMAEGSARVKLGDTDVMVGVKMEVGTPFPDTPDKGVLTTSAELIPMASPVFESGPPDENAIELARVVDRGIRESDMIDLQELCITEEEEVWIVFLDIYILDYDGNLFDASALGAAAALKSATVPAKRYDKGEDFPLSTSCTPVSCTAVQIENSLLFDPTLDEEKIAAARLTVTTDETGDIRAMQKGLEGALTLDQIKTIIEKSQELAKDLRKHLG